MKYTIYYFFTEPSCNFSVDVGTEENMNEHFEHIKRALDEWNRPSFMNKIFSRCNYYTIVGRNSSSTISLRHLIGVQKKIKGICANKEEVKNEL